MAVAVVVVVVAGSAVVSVREPVAIRGSEQELLAPVVLLKYRSYSVHS